MFACVIVYITGRALHVLLKKWAVQSRHVRAKNNADQVLLFVFFLEKKIILKLCMLDLGLYCSTNCVCNATYYWDTVANSCGN